MPSHPTPSSSSISLERNDDIPEMAVLVNELDRARQVQTLALQEAS